MKSTLLQILTWGIVFFILAQKRRQFEAKPLPVASANSSEACEERTPLRGEHEVESCYPFEANKLFFYLNKKREKTGPFSGQAMGGLFQREELNLETLIWTQGMEKWAPVRSLITD